MAMDPLSGASWLLIPYRELHLRLSHGAIGISGRNVLLATGGSVSRYQRSASWVVEALWSEGEPINELREDSGRTARERPLLASLL